MRTDNLVSTVNSLDFSNVAWSGSFAVFNYLNIDVHKLYVGVFHIISNEIISVKLTLTFFIPLDLLIICAVGCRLPVISCQISLKDNW